MSTYALDARSHSQREANTVCLVIGNSFWYSTAVNRIKLFLTVKLTTSKVVRWISNQLPIIVIERGNIKEKKISMELTLMMMSLNFIQG